MSIRTENDIKLFYCTFQGWSQCPTTAVNHLFPTQRIYPVIIQSVICLTVQSIIQFIIHLHFSFKLTGLHRVMVLHFRETKSCVPSTSACKPIIVWSFLIWFNRQTIKVLYWLKSASWLVFTFFTFMLHSLCSVNMFMGFILAICDENKGREYRKDVIQYRKDNIQMLLFRSLLADLLSPPGPGVPLKEINW